MNTITEKAFIASRLKTIGAFKSELNINDSELETITVTELEQKINAIWSHAYNLGSGDLCNMRESIGLPRFRSR
jgi:hypothetical protein